MFLLFLQIFQRPPHCLHHKGGEGAVFALDLGFHLLNDIVGKADAFAGGGSNGGNFKFFYGDLLVSIQGLFSILAKTNCICNKKGTVCPGFFHEKLGIAAFP